MPDLGAILDNLGTVSIAVAWAFSTVWLVQTGRFVPRRTHQDVLDQNRELRLKEDTKDRVIAEQSQQLDQMANVAHIVETALSQVIPRNPS